MAEGKTNMFGKTYNTIGSTDSNFIIKTKGDLKIQWGNKFIDLIKNGKIVSENSNLLFTVISPDDIKQNGIYIVTAANNNELWVCINGTKVQIANNSEETTYISFLKEQQLTQNQKYQALKNIGFYYDDIQNAKSANISSGIIYVENENKLYVAKNGVLQEYLFNTINQEKITSSEKHPLYIQDYSLWTNELEHIRCQGNTYIITDLVLYNNLQSLDATEDSGYRLYVDEKGSTLEIDHLDWRKYPIPITYKELQEKIFNKRLVPKMYYLLTDFQNPWEVTWEDEPIYYEDQYTKINNQEYLSAYRNALQLIIKAKTSDSIEEQVWSPLHPEWIIHYDPYYKGPEHLEIINGESIIQYGFRTRIIQDEISIEGQDPIIKKRTIYLSCKGKIIYLKDELGNEGTFNFRHHKFKKLCYDKETDQYYTVWRYCIDNIPITSEPFITFGSFSLNSKNNKFILESIESYVQLTTIDIIIDQETNNLLEYIVEPIDSDVLITEGTNIAIHSTENIHDNTFEKLKTGDFYITEVPNLYNNVFYDINDLKVISAVVINNNFNNVILHFSGGNYDGNTIIGKNSTVFFSFIFGVSFINNYIEDCEGFNNFPHVGSFIGNSFIRSLIDINNVEVDSISAGNAGYYENNTIIDSTVNIKVSDFHLKDFKYNTIKNSTINTTNYGSITNNTINNSIIEIINELQFEENAINDSDININNKNIIKNNNITNSELSIYNMINGVSILSNNDIVNVEQITNNKTIQDNKLTDIKVIDNEEDISDNTITGSDLITNQGILTQNIIKSESITNQGTIKNNNIENIKELINTSNIQNNIFGTIIKIENNATIKDNIIVQGKTIINHGNLLKNTIDVVNDITNLNTIQENIIKFIINIDNKLDAIIKNNKIDTHNGSIINEGNILNNTITNIYQDLEIANNITNNSITELTNNIIQADMDNNIIISLVDCSILGILRNNNFQDLIKTTFNNITENNIFKNTISECTFQDISDCVVFRPISKSNFNNSVEDCIFYKEITNLEAHKLELCNFKKIDNLNLDDVVVNADFHGHIKGDDPDVRELTQEDWKLLSNTTKKVDVYPNIYVVDSVDISKNIIQKGMILMWSGSEDIPEGWAICDGNNGTPNLIGKFIKASDTANQTGGGGNYTADGNNNYIKLEVENLPDHTHSIPELTTTSNGEHSHGHIEEYTSWVSGVDQTYDISYIEATEGNTLDSIGLKSTNYSVDIGSYKGTTDPAGDHSHTIPATSTSGTTNANNTPFSIEPSYFSLIFIMKLDPNIQQN